MRSVLGVFLASLALFFFGFLFWGLNPLPYQSWSKPTDEPGAMEALRKHFPERGTYFCPSFDADPKVTDEKFRKGPLAFVFLLTPQGRPVEDPRIMIQGYLLSLVGLSLITVQMRQVRTALPTYRSRVLFAAVSGVIASVMILIGDVVWWQMPLPWKLWQGLYHVLGWTISGAVLARFVEDK
ncbi:MAG: hypothetical protein U0941_27660 [Planctomycetaceae bacterium]